MIRENWVTTFVAKNNNEIKVRHLRADDTESLIYVFEHMSPESRYQRFHQTLENPNPKQIREEAEHIVHSAMNTGLIAFANLPDESEVPIGVARFVCMEPGVADVALSVRDDQQGMGIGTRLLQLIVEEARLLGVRRLVGTVLNDNDAMWVVFDRLDYPVHREIEGTVSEVVIDLLGRRS